jgi:hypothetical protein
MKPPVRTRTVGRVLSRGQTESTPVELTFEYHRRDPYAVTLLVPSRRGVTEWVFARELLADGRLGIEGPGGDVTVAPGADRGDVLIDLLSPSGHAVLWVVDEDVNRFLDATYRLVPAGTENRRIQWGRELTDLLTGGAR